MNGNYQTAFSTYISKFISNLQHNQELVFDIAILNNGKLWNLYPNF